MSFLMEGRFTVKKLQQKLSKILENKKVNERPLSYTPTDLGFEEAKERNQGEIHALETTIQAISGLTSRTKVQEVLAEEIRRLQETHGFHRQTGWVQVDGHGKLKNFNYGVWSMICFIQEELR